VIKEEQIIEGMDAEWMALIFEAREIGIAQETIREFLNQKSVKEVLFEK
jgi:hypothetical protein